MEVNMNIRGIETHNFTTPSFFFVRFSRSWLSSQLHWPSGFTWLQWRTRCWHFSL